MSWAADIIVRSIAQLLEAFYFRAKPLGVAFVSYGSADVSFGRPCSFVLPNLGSTDGFSEFHLENWGASFFVSSFGKERFLVAQFPFAADDSRMETPSSFLRLATAVQRELETPSSSAGPPTDGVTATRPSPQPRPKPRSAEASFDDE